MNLFEKIITESNGTIKCDICGGDMHAVYGCGWDNDRLDCDDWKCGAEVIFSTSTMPKDIDVDGELESA